MSAPLSNELFFDVHRGIGTNKVNEPLGVHWSRDKSKASEIGAKNTDSGKHVVLHGRMPLSSVETNLENLKSMGWGLSDEETRNWLAKDPLGEKEVMAKRGAPILVTGSTKSRVTKSGWRKERKRTFRQPREMQA